MTKDTLQTFRTNPPPLFGLKNIPAQLAELTATAVQTIGEAATNTALSGARDNVQKIAALGAALASASPRQPATPASSAAVAHAAVDPLKKTHAEFMVMRPEDRQQFAQDGGRLLMTDFQRLTPSAQSKFCRDGGRLCDESAKPEPKVSANGRVLNRAAFELLSPELRSDFFKFGGKLTD